VTADAPSIAPLREGGLKSSGNFCEVCVKAEVAVGLSACRNGQIKSTPVTSSADFQVCQWAEFG